jgi:DNA-binding CsgD family transcriptional regulator
VATTIQANLQSESPLCFICSNHPLAVSLINDVICSDPNLREYVRNYFAGCQSSVAGKLELLILDTCSVPKWEGRFQEWHSKGGIVISLVPRNSQNGNIALQMLHLGAAGVVNFSEKLPEELPSAIHAVANGQVWIRRELMEAYLQWTSSTIWNLTVSDQRFTGREKQILHLLREDRGNRVIAQKLAVSERTIKFHVSNILRKLRLTNRRELQSLGCSNGSLNFRPLAVSVKPNPGTAPVAAGEVLQFCSEDTGSTTKSLLVSGGE